MVKYQSKVNIANRLQKRTDLQVTCFDFMDRQDFELEIYLNEGKIVCR